MPRAANRQARTGRAPWRRALVGAGIGVASYAAVAILAHVLLPRLPPDPNGPGAWKFAAVSIGILAVAVVIVLGFIPGWSRRRDARRAAAASDPHARAADAHRSLH